jgi:4-hydroxyphenylpyruvate dioxygenase-like putative hemolysin
MTTDVPAQRLHHVTFAVAPERFDAATHLFTELGFAFNAGELPDAGLHLRLDWERGIELITPMSGSTAAVATRVNEFLSENGDGVYTVVLQVPVASAAESVAARYGSSTRYRFDISGDGTYCNEVELSVLGLPLTFMSTNIA